MGNGEADVADIFTPTTVAEAEVRHVLNWKTNGALEKKSLLSHITASRETVKTN